MHDSMLAKVDIASYIVKQFAFVNAPFRYLVHADDFHLEFKNTPNGPKE